MQICPIPHVYFAPPFGSIAQLEFHQNVWRPKTRLGLPRCMWHWLHDDIFSHFDKRCMLDRHSI